MKGLPPCILKSPCETYGVLLRKRRNRQYQRAKALADAQNLHYVPRESLPLHLNRHLQHPNVWQEYEYFVRLTFPSKERYNINKTANSLTQRLKRFEVLEGLATLTSSESNLKNGYISKTSLQLDLSRLSCSSVDDMKNDDPMADWKAKPQATRHFQNKLKYQWHRLFSLMICPDPRIAQQLSEDPTCPFLFGQPPMWRSHCLEPEWLKITLIALPKSCKYTNTNRPVVLLEGKHYPMTWCDLRSRKRGRNAEHTPHTATLPKDNSRPNSLQMTMMCKSSRFTNRILEPKRSITETQTPVSCNLQTLCLSMMQDNDHPSIP